MKTISAVAFALLLVAPVARAAEAIPAMQPSELSVDARLAEAFAREALAEPADRPVYSIALVVHQGQPFWRVHLVGSFKTAYVHASGDLEGTAIVEDERDPKPAFVLAP